MELICKGYNTCDERFDCHHAKPHEKIKNICEYDEPGFLQSFNECQCHNKYLRKRKLEKINENR